MPSQEEGTQYAHSVHDPQDVAAATIAVAKARSELPAANWDFINRMLESRLEQLLEQEQRLRERSADIDKRAAEAERQIGIRISETERCCAARVAETEKHCAERLAAVDGFCLEARQKSHEVIVTSHKQAGELITARLAELGQIAEATHALAKPAPPRPSGGEVLGELGKVAFGRLFDVVQESFKYNPDFARKVSGVASTVLGASPEEAPQEPAGAVPAEGPRAPAAAAAPPPGSESAAAPVPTSPAATAAPSYTLGQVAEAASALTQPELTALMQRWGIPTLDHMTREHADELMKMHRNRGRGA